MEIRVGEGVTYYEDVHPEIKEAIVVLHGWGQSSTLWLPWARQISDYRIIIPDLPAFGRSTGLPSPAGVAKYAQWVKLLIEKLELGPVILLGHSFGGQIAVQAAVDHQKLVARLVLVAPAVVRDKRGFLKVKANLMRIMAQFKRFLPSQWAYSLSSSEDWAKASPAQKQVMATTLREDVADRLPQITQETLLVWGEHDREVMGNPKQLIEQIPQGRLKVIYNAGHNLHVEKPDEVLRITERWINA